MEQVNKTAAWLGVTTAIVGLLAFFGINNFDELQRKVAPESANTSACKKADHAYNGYLLSSYGNAQAARTYAEELRQAGSATDDEELRGAFDATITTMNLYAQAHDRKAPFEERLALRSQAMRDEKVWQIRCGYWGKGN
ncbi:hypothetical protein [Streptomyces sp. NPDC057460]|uniref:hypothetical protein n=1 Tax=Streptomyces sp. NPDC057460 TaxID=3346141 RepID=UPI0036C91E2D